MADKESAIILVKAAPHPSQRYEETVCCAGVTPNGEWRRLYPVRYRHLQGASQFSRWDVVEYAWRRPVSDPRHESRRVEEQSLRVTHTMPKGAREGFFDRLLRPSISAAADRGESLTLIRPLSLKFKWRQKKDQELAAERVKIEQARRQGSLLDAPLSELEPCPMHLYMGFESRDRAHLMLCGDWETSATFYKWRRQYGEQSALMRLQEVYEQSYFRDGVALALGTVAKRPKQWLLLGILKLEETRQPLLI